MKLAAVICEYNPFHNGHAYQLRKAARAADGVVCLMSGDFVQRAEPAVCDKYVRAECALYSDASMVVELPVSVSVSPGERFAYGAVEAATHIPQVKKLVMGCETAQPEILSTLAAIQAEESDAFKNDLKEKLAAGASYAQSYAFATVNAAIKAGYDGAMCGEVLAKPNNLLCISYIKALKQLGADIEPVIIPRKGNGYNDMRLGEFASATAIRANLEKTDAVRAAMPPACADKFLRAVAEHPVDRKLYQALVVDAIRRSTPEQLAEVADVAEGLEHKLYKNACQYFDLEKILEETKSKRYTRARLNRICVHVLLQMTSAPARLRVLGVKEDFKPYLSTLDDRFYVKTSELHDGENQNEKRADAVYTLITHTDGNRFYSNRLVTVR